MTLQTNHNYLFDNETFKFLNDKNKSAFKYLLRYNKYIDVVNNINEYRIFLDKTKRTTGYYLTLQTLENQMSHAETRTREIILHMAARFLSDKAFVCDAKVMENFLKGDLLNVQFLTQIDKSILVFPDLDLLSSASPNEIINFKNNIERLKKSCFILFQGKENLLTRINEILSDSPLYHFNLALEYDIEEMKYAVEMYFKQENFIFEQGWEKYFNLYMAKPNSISKMKNINFYEELTTMLRTATLTDIHQVKHENKYLVIKNEYFAVKEASSFHQLKSLKKLDNLIGMNEAKQSVEELIAYLDFNTKLQSKVGKSFPLNLHMMFTGDPGTGKTTLARIVAEILYELNYIKSNKLVEVDKKDLISQYVGHTSIKTNEVIQSARGGVLFIDEAYSIVDDKYGQDAIATLIKAMEDLKTELVVIVAGYKDEMEKFINSNPGMSSRIGKKIHFVNYSPDELMQIYKMKLEDYQIQTSNKALEQIHQIVSEYRNEENFGNGRFIDNLIQDILFQHAVNTLHIQNDEILFTISENDIPSKYFEKN